MRLVDADAITDEMLNKYRVIADKDEVRKLINDLPTVDIVREIRDDVSNIGVSIFGSEPSMVYVPYNEVIQRINARMGIPRK